jgi:surface antigen
MPSRLIRFLRIVTFAVIATMAASGFAHAQLGNPFASGDLFGPFRLGPGDQAIIRARVQTLLDGPAEPRTLEWQNPRSGNSGSVGLMSEFTRRSRQCRQIEYRTVPRAADLPEVEILVWCKRHDGRWRIVA